MKLNGKLNTESKRLLQDLIHLKSENPVITIYQHASFYTAAISFPTKNPPSSFGHLQDGQGVWRFSDKEKAVKIIRKFDANTPIEFVIGK